MALGENTIGTVVPETSDSALAMAEIINGSDSFDSMLADATRKTKNQFRGRVDDLMSA